MTKPAFYLKLLTQALKLHKKSKSMPRAGLTVDEFLKTLTRISREITDRLHLLVWTPQLFSCKPFLIHQYSYRPVMRKSWAFRSAFTFP